MEKKISIKRNFIMNIILTLSSVIFPFISFRYVSKILTPVGTGKVSFATSVLSYYWIIACLGVPTYGIRAVAKCRDNREELTKTVHELFIISTLTTIIAYFLLFISLSFVPRFQEDKLLYWIISLEMILYTIGMEWLYRGLERYSYITKLSLIFKIVAVILMLLLIHEQKDYFLYGFLTIFASGACYILYFINAHNYVDIRYVGNYDLKRHLKPVLVFFAMSCATTIYTHLDSVMLGFIASDADVGFYNAAVKIKVLMVSVVTSLGAVLLPRASYYIQHKQYEEFKNIGSKAINFVFLVSCPIILYFIIFAEPGIFFISDQAYAPGIPAMRVIMPTVLFIGLTNILGIQMLVPLGKEKVVLHSEIAGAVVDIIINAILIPKYKATGAAIGTVFAEMVVLLVQYYALRDIVKDIFRKIEYPKILCALLLSCVMTFWIKNLNLSNFMILLESSLLFFGCYFVALLVAKEKLVFEIYQQMLEKIKHKFYKEA